MSGVRGLLASLSVAALAWSAGGGAYEPLAGTAVSLGESAQGPTLSLAPASGLPGTSAEATGSGYTECLGPGEGADPTTGPGSGPGVGPGSVPSVIQADGQVVLLWDEVELSPRAGLDDAGAFTTSFAVPASATPGVHVVMTRCAGSESARVLASDTFRVTAAPTQTTEVPDLITRTVAEARTALEAAGLVLGNRPDGTGRIRSQAPVAGTRVALGTPVTVFLAADRKPPAPGGPATGGALPGGAVPPPGEPTTGTSAQVPPAQPPSAAQPLPPAPATDTFFRGWVLLILLVLILLGVLGATVIRQIRAAPAWVATYVRAARRRVPGTEVIVAESRVDDTSRSCVVRIIPHREDSTQVLEV